VGDDVGECHSRVSRVGITGFATIICQRTFATAGGCSVDDETRVSRAAVPCCALAFGVGDIAVATAAVQSGVLAVEYVEGRAVGVCDSANTVAVSKRCVGIDIRN